ncbi:MAG: glycosyltransferase [Candidatus Levybacteria bacterium]|nr:glycosyltransferase [Candidatus Levybacteria bacterium]
MKVALVHDYIKEYGGAERVLETLHEIWPDAPVFTTVYLPEFLGPHQARFRNLNIKTSFLQYLPFKAKLISPIRLIAPFVFKTFDFSQFDAVIVSATGAYSPNLLNTKYKIHNTIHVCYCHTPPRYLYGYATAREWKKNLVSKILGEIANHFLRLIDFKSAQNVDYFIANSKNVSQRISKFYRRNSTVIYPPIDTNSMKYEVLSIEHKKNTKYSILNTQYYLTGGRIAKPKHIDLIIETFTKLKLPLIVFGRSFAGHDSQFMIHDSNVKFVGEVSDEEKLKLMKNAKAFVFASEDEDFGITPVEAMSTGTPVIAYKSGGVVESVLQGRTGIFFDALTIDGLSKAIKQFNNLTIDPKECIKQAEKFGKERFKKEIQLFVESAYKKNL